MKKFFKQLLLAIILIIIVIFSAQNFETVKISFLKWNLEIPLFLSLIAIYFLGTISGSLLFSMFRTITKSESK
jgi:uncharacterized integral membrane protein